MGVVPAKLKIFQIDRATFDFRLQFFQDPAKTIPLDLTNREIRSELWDKNRRALKATFDVEKLSVAGNNEAYFRLEPGVQPTLLRGVLWLDVLFVEPDSSSEGFRRDYYLQVEVDFGRGYTT
jgi:hypothetical protein